MKNTKYIIVLCVTALTLSFGGCSTDAEYYSEVTPATFFDSQDNVWQRFYRPLTHWRWYIASNHSRWFLQELGTDEMCLPTRGSDWYNGGAYQQMHHHEFTYTMGDIWTTWYGFSMGVALAWDAWEDINEFVDFNAMGFEEGTKESMRAQLNALVAFYYKDGLDFFGGLPLYTTTNTDIKGRSTALQTFNFADSLLNEAMPFLPVKTTLGAMENGSVNRAAGAALKAQLYFNAKSYIGKDMFAECAEICQDIIDGEYGAYELADDWTDVFGFNNESCAEILWSVPSENSKLQTDVNNVRGRHYNQGKFMGGIDVKGWNGFCLTPSLKPNGEEYEYKLGKPYSKFEESDIRKQQYVYTGNGSYRGMFIVGELINPIDGGTCKGSREYKGKTITIIDQISYFKKLGITYDSVDDLPSDISTAEENSGVRLMKRGPLPSYAERELAYNPDVPVIRLAEIYYMLAECKMRAGKPEEAAILINTVRKRNFENELDPNPVTAANLDKYRMLDEWMIEFVEEGRRRTDLIRWDAYVTEDWWDHKATNNPDFNLYPIPEKAISSNSLLEPNPGY